MKRFLIIGLVILLAGTALFNGVISLQNKIIDSEEFTLGDMESYINITDPSLEITTHGTKKYNNEANIYVYNNATYTGLKFDVSADMLNGVYPSNVAIDLGNNGRDEYRFSGPGVGQWGNQSFLFDNRLKQGTTLEVFPPPEGLQTFVKLPSRATVSNVEFDIEHPILPTYQESLFTSDNTIEVANAYAYNYNYDYYTGTDDWYGYGYYYPKQYHDYTDSYFMNNIYTGYPYKSTSYDRYISYLNRGYLAWDLDHPDFAVPTGATILQYELNYPIRRYHYSSSYGFEWESNPPSNYFSAAKDWGVFAVTSDLPDTFNTLASKEPIVYYDSQTLDQWPDYFPDWYNNYLPSNRTTPVDTYEMEDHFYTTSYEDLYDVSYDLSALYKEWVTGSLDNNGIMMTMYKTDYSDEPHFEHVYAYYNDDMVSSQAWSKNCFYFTYCGYTYNPLYTASTSYQQYYPKLVVGFDLASTDLKIDVGADKNIEFNQVGAFSGKVKLGGTPAYTNAINTYLKNHLPDEIDLYGNEFTYVPIEFMAESAGKIVVSNIRINYDYSARVNFNPTTGSILKELNSLISKNEDGWSLIRINVTSNTDGIINFDNLKLLGNRPNYGPSVTEIITPPVPEGTVNRNWVEISQYFHDVDQDPSTLEYWVKSNSQSKHLDLFITEPQVEGGPVFLGIDTSKDRDWNGEVKVVIGAKDNGGKDVISDPFIITVQPVNDLPYAAIDLPVITGEEGLDPILIEYSAPTGRNIATGKISMLISGDGSPYFSDIEGQDIHLSFQLLDKDMKETYLDISNDEGFKIYRAGGDITMTVLPPEYTDDPDNFIIVIGSNPDYNYEKGMYYLRIFTSDDPYDLYGQTYHTIPIMISPVNDAPGISVIPDIVLDEDSTYTGNVDFIAEYLIDSDSGSEDLSVSFIPSSSKVKVYLDNGNYLHVDPDMDFSGVVSVTIAATDGMATSFSTFTVGIRSINDAPRVAVSNLFDGRIIDDMFYIRGTANDIEKTLRWVEVGIVEGDGFLYEDDWQVAEGAYVWQYLLDIRDMSRGDYDVFVRAYDGRDYSEVLEFTITVESVIGSGSLSPPPLVQITSLMNGELKDRVEVEGTVSDDSGFVDFVEYRIDGGLWRKAAVTGETWKAIINTRTLTNDNHNLSIRAYDGKSYSQVVFKPFEVMNEDSDLDGITNDMEIILQLDPFNPLDGTMDFDEDGFSNAEEVEANTDIFDGGSHPEIKDNTALMDSWALIFIAVALIAAIVIIALFILNIRIEKNMHQWREDLHGKRMGRKPKTLLQKIVELAPTFAGNISASSGPALPGSYGSESDTEALPPAPEGYKDQ